MQEKKDFLYMKKWGDYTIAIIYSFGAYYIARLLEKGERGMAYTLRRYKTLSGAEKYLKEKVTAHPEGTPEFPELFYGTEEIIREGKYWKL